MGEIRVAIPFFAHNGGRRKLRHKSELRIGSLPRRKGKIHFASGNANATDYIRKLLKNTRAYSKLEDNECFLNL